MTYDEICSFYDGIMTRVINDGNRDQAMLIVQCYVMKLRDPFGSTQLAEERAMEAIIDYYGITGEEINRAFRS